MTRIAVYPGSFDPPTRGHTDLISRSLALADQVIVAIANNLTKQPLFTRGGTADHAAGGDGTMKRGSGTNHSKDCWWTSPARWERI